jgi:hypothetical protein
MFAIIGRKMKAAVGTTPKNILDHTNLPYLLQSSLLLRGIHFGETRLAELICQTILTRDSLYFPTPSVNLPGLGWRSG